MPLAYNYTILELVAKALYLQYMRGFHHETYTVAKKFNSERWDHEIIARREHFKSLATELLEDV